MLRIRLSIGNYFFIWDIGKGGNEDGNKNGNETTGNTHQNNCCRDLSDHDCRQRIGKYPADQRYRHRSGIGCLSEFVCTRRIDVFDLGRHLPFVGWSCALPIRLIPRGQEQGENGTA
ncbi:hypothetical protein SDC9_137919 [bioreactor metagenome]|uniref:Uncharacterized protein n=1 Tax=bioreactor metagenome TaxID=1076179 RepID=A0A645DND3_9ZZZZ